MSISNGEELRNFLVADMERVSSGEITAATANASANLSGKILQSIKLELEYCHLTGNTPSIKFLDHLSKKSEKLKKIEEKNDNL